MMELGYLYIIFLFSFVSATPYGYGTKGGASARASATSSTFGSQSVLPLSVPFGSGFSGSFSKSSSSSFASSSSSSSSSSSAFSFGSSNANKLGFNDGTGCGPSGCQNIVPSSDAIRISETTSGINTAATALGGLQNSECGSQNCQQSDASFVSGSGIVKDNQDYKSTDITSTSYLGHLGIDTQHSGCSSGACHQSGANIISGDQLSSVLGAEQKKSDSNTDGTFGAKSGPSFGCKDSKCSSFGTNYKPHFTESEENPSNYVASQKCSPGQCTSNSEKETINVPLFNANYIPAKTYQPERVDHFEHNLSDTRDHYYPSNCKTLDCTSHQNSASGATNGNIGYKQPVAFLQTPKGTTCFSSNCQQESQIGETKPSSYDVPIHGGVNTLQVDSLSSTHKNPSLSYNFPSPEAGSSNCKTSQCVGQSFTHPGSIQFGTPSTQQFDSKYSSIGLPSSNTPTIGSSGVYRPNGFSVDITSPKPAVISQGEYHISAKPNVQHSTETIPSYDFSEAPGSVKPHDFTGFEITHSTHFIKPQVVMKPSNEEAYTGGFGGPPGLLKPNEFNFNSNFATPPIKHTTTSKPNVTPDQKLPTYTGGFLLKPHEFDNFKPVNSNNQQADVSQIGLPDITKPDILGKPSSQIFPTYTGGFNGLTETVKPNKLNTDHSSVTTNPPFHHTGINEYFKPSFNDKPLDHKLPTHSSEISRPSGLLKPSQIDTAKPSVNVNTETVAHTEFSNVVNPITFEKQQNQNFPAYTAGLSQPAGTIRPNKLNSGLPSGDFISEALPQNEPSSFIKPVASVKPLDQNLPTYTGGFGGPSGLLKPNEFNVAKPSVNVNTEKVGHTGLSNFQQSVAFDKPLNQNTVGLSGPTGAPHTNEFNVPHHPSSTGIFSHTEYPFSKPSATDKPSNQILPTGSFSGPPESLKPSEIIFGHPLVDTNTAAIAHLDHPYIKKPVTVDVKVPIEKLPTHTVGFNKPSGLLKPSQLDINNVAVSYTDNSAVANPITISKPSEQKLPTQTGDKPIGFYTGQSSVSANRDAIVQTEHQVFNEPSADIKPSTEKLPTYTSGFGEPSGLLKPNEFDTAKPSVNENNAADVPTGHPDDIKRVSFENLPTYTSGFGEPLESNKTNVFVSGHTLADTNTAAVLPANVHLPSNPHGFGKPSELHKPSQLDTVHATINANNRTMSDTLHSSIANPISISKPSDQKIQANTSGFDEQLELGKPNKFNADHSLTTVSANTDATTNTGYHAITKPSSVVKPSDEKLSIYTDGFGGSSGLLKPNVISGSDSSVNVNSGTGSQAAHPSIGNSNIKPTNLPTYTNSFDGSSELEKSNVLNNVSPSTNLNVAPYLQKQQTISTSSAAKAEAVAYSGGFGGPPGLLTPNDGGRLSSTVNSGKVPFDSQFGDKYGTIPSDIGFTSVNVGNTNSDSSISGFGTTGGSKSLDFTKVGLGNIDSATGINSDHKEISAINKENMLPYSKRTNDTTRESASHIGVPSIAIAEASASADAKVDTSTTLGSSNGSEDKLSQVFDNKQKATGGCASGCGRGAYGGATNFGFGGSLSKPGYFGGWNSGLSGASASAQSTAGALSGARAFSVGGSYASSSASAHASSGYPTKGGYGK